MRKRVKTQASYKMGGSVLQQFGVVVQTTKMTF